MLLLDYRLDVYIHDYFVKRYLKAIAQAFLAEGKVFSYPVGKQKIECKDQAYLSCEFSVFIYNSGGFLFEWWSVFRDMFIARTNKKHSSCCIVY